MHTRLVIVWAFLAISFGVELAEPLLPKTRAQHRRSV